MTKYARIVENIVIEIFTPQEGFVISECFTPEVVDMFSEVPDNVTTNSTIDTKGVWIIAATPPPPSPQVTHEKVTPMTFQMLFTSSERIAIKAAAKTDPIIEDWWSIATNPQLTEVNLGLTSVHEALDYLVQQNMLTEDRKIEVLSAEVK